LSFPRITSTDHWMEICYLSSRSGLMSSPHTALCPQPLSLNWGLLLTIIQLLFLP
jgi:hypothetical protein